MALVFPREYHRDELNDNDKMKRVRRDAGNVILDILEARIPCFGVAMNNVKIRKLSMIVDKLAYNTAGALTKMNSELLAMRAMVM